MTFNYTQKQIYNLVNCVYVKLQKKGLNDKI
jgi:hypothetical protein